MISLTFRHALLNVAAGAMTIAAVLVGRHAWVHVFGGGEQPAESDIAESGFVSDWQRLAVGPYGFGDESAPVSIVEFADFECPYCRKFAAVLDTLMMRKPGVLRVSFHQFPLTDAHPHAMAMAVASECARDQGQFKAYYDAAYLSRPALASLPTMPDTAAFDACLHSSRATLAVERDWSIGKDLNVQGTPTLFVNGHRYEGALSYRQLDSIVEVVRGHPSRPPSP